ncbi:MAG: TonB-dependent receptor [Rhodanobacteraceae bacterium]|jgi:outer membrane receptor protein involved in Fe transport|nr:TonB-dependent receptor [Rhodanobacteraceae bacterium]
MTAPTLVKPAHSALFLGVSAALALQALPAAAQAQDQGQQTERLGTVVVTGSRIRRVDLETSNPVVTIGREAIQKSGKVTVGDLVQELPSIAGNASNPQVNNGGGDGGSYVSLRGLGINRTLLLINGRRAISGDVNSIPANIIERIEVLKDGASSVYGSDAIGGVVNFILRKDYEGAEFTADYGQSDYDDGKRKGYSFTFGHTADKGSVMAGVNYNKFDPVSSGARDFSSQATYFSSGEVASVLGSSRTPTGRIYVPAELFPQLGCNADSNGNISLTLKNPSGGRSPGDYQCYSSGRDAYNYQAVNLLLTPQERTGLFVVGNYQLTEGVQVYLDAFHNKTVSNFAIAPLPFDARSDAVEISANNYYNPFGVNFGPGDGVTADQQFLSRFTSLGQRRGYYSTTVDQVATGFKGGFGESSWQWDASFIYGNVNQSSKSKGYVYYAGLREALGPSFLDPATGLVTCGTPDAPIANCTPLNIFNINDPQTISTLQKYATTPKYDVRRKLRSGELNASGELFELPAGTMSLAVGATYRKEDQTNEVDYIAIADSSGNCAISQEACSSPLAGGFNVKELYGELFVPVLKDMPFAHALNLTIGTRYSKYSNVGNTTNSKIAIEWRPIEDLMLRGTVSEVFRAPNLTELYAGYTGDAPIFHDPCIGADLSNPNLACQNVPPGFAGTGLSQSTGVLTGAVISGVQLKPEYGKSYDFGVVYDPHWIEGLSLNADYWRITLNDTIISVNAQTVANICFADNSSPFCRFINRYSDGNIRFITEPTANLGRLDASGIDFGFRYALPEFSFGKFLVTFDSTYIRRYDNQASDLLPTRHVAGHYDGQYGNFARWRALAGLNWQKGPFDASWRITYIGRVSVGSEDPSQNSSADGCYLNPECDEGPWTNTPTRLHYGAYAYNNVSFGYNYEPWKSRVEVGVDNLMDKQPPIFYQNNVLNANTDVNTYNTVGRFYWARVSVRF